MGLYQDLGFSPFQIQIVLSLWVPIEKTFCFSKQIYHTFVSLKKIFENDIINREDSQDTLGGGGFCKI